MRCYFTIAISRSHRKINFAVASYPHIICYEQLKINVNLMNADMFRSEGLFITYLNSTLRN